MKIKTFAGVAECVDELVNEFASEVDVRGIQTHATGKNSSMVTVIYEEGTGDGR